MFWVKLFEVVVWFWLLLFGNYDVSVMVEVMCEMVVIVFVVIVFMLFFLFLFGFFVVCNVVLSLGVCGIVWLLFVGICGILELIFVIVFVVIIGFGV